tara:strand:- start:384 stop:1115 length:732 start_codon:yes stop_codon:yes gene_type:complete
MIKKRRRVRRKRGTGPSLYFHKGTHDAIVRYQDSEDHGEREEIYVTDILPAFNKLVENLIFMHGFAKINGSYEDLKGDCVSFLYETLGKFDPSRGSKAFSYFNVVAKNWLIIKSKQTIKRNKRHVSMEDILSIRSADSIAVESHSVAPSPAYEIIKAESIADLFQMLDTIKGRLKGENEIACIDAVITLFNSIDELEFLNKRAIFVYMRELSNLNAKQLSIAMSIIRKHYREISKNGDFDIFF